MFLCCIKADLFELFVKVNFLLLNSVKSIYHITNLLLLPITIYEVLVTSSGGNNGRPVRQERGLSVLLPKFSMARC